MRRLAWARGARLCPGPRQHPGAEPCHASPGSWAATDDPWLVCHPENQRDQQVEDTFLRGYRSGHKLWLLPRRSGSFSAETYESHTAGWAGTCQLAIAVAWLRHRLKQQHVHRDRQDTNRRTVFPGQSCPSVPDLRLLPEADLVALRFRRPRAWGGGQHAPGDGLLRIPAPLRESPGPASLLLTLSQVTVLLFQSDRLTPAALLQPSEVICVRCWAFGTIRCDKGIRPLLAKATRQWADSQGVWQTCHAPYHPQASGTSELGTFSLHLLFSLAVLYQAFPGRLSTLLHRALNGAVFCPLSDTRIPAGMFQTPRAHLVIASSSLRQGMHLSQAVSSSWLKQENRNSS